MKQQALTLLTCILIAMSITGFAYAQWNDIIVISNTMEFGHLTLRFVDPLDFSDNDDATKDVGECTCEYANPDPGGYKTLKISMTNAYPSYEAYCTFTLKNVGTMPEHITGITITGRDETEGKDLVWVPDPADPEKGELQQDGKPIFSIVITPDLVCQILWPGDDPDTPEIELTTQEAQISIHITQNAEECYIYSFEVQITYEQVVYP